MLYRLVSHVPSHRVIAVCGFAQEGSFVLTRSFLHVASRQGVLRLCAFITVYSILGTGNAAANKTDKNPSLLYQFCNSSLHSCFLLVAHTIAVHLTGGGCRMWAGNGRDECFPYVLIVLGGLSPRWW